MLALFVMASLAFAVFAAAQSNNTELQIEAIEAHFEQSGIVQSNGLLTSFTPTALLSVSYASLGVVSPGQALGVDTVATTPSLTVTAGNQTTLSGQYTVIMVDAGPVGTDETQGQTRHWLLNGVTIASNGTVDNTTATVIEDYAGPAPPANSGPHRYVVLLYSQPATFASPDDVVDGVTVIQLSEYVQNSGLGPLVAANYFTVETGMISYTPSVTTAVVTSTLPAALTTASSTLSKVTTSVVPSSTTSARSGDATVSLNFISFLAGVAVTLYTVVVL